MKKKIFLSAGLVLVGAAVGIAMAMNGWWNIAEPVAWTVQMAVLAIALIRSWLLERKLESTMEQKSFQITFGLRRGYEGDSADHSVADADIAILEWMMARVTTGLSVVTGMSSSATLFYPVRNTEDGSRVTRESSAIFTGSLSPKYDKGRSDLEVVDTLNSLASHIGLALGQKRIYVSYNGKQWTLDLNC